MKVLIPSYSCIFFFLLYKVDNTVKECKNNSFIKFLCWAILQKGLEVGGMCMARVGHTHCATGFLVAIHDYLEACFFTWLA